MPHVPHSPRRLSPRRQTFIPVPPDRIQPGRCVSDGDPGATQLASRILEQGALVINRGGTVGTIPEEGGSHQGIISEAWIAIRMGRCNVM